MVTINPGSKTLSYARHIGRELAFLTVSSLNQHYQYDELEQVVLAELLERSVRVLLSEAEDHLETAGKGLQEVYEHLLGLELDESAFSGKEPMRLLKQKASDLNAFRGLLLDQTQQMERACHLMEQSMQLPLLRILSDTPQIREFALELASQYQKHRKEVDESIDAVSTEWPLDRMNSIDRDLIRIAATEMFYDPFSHQLGGDSTPLPVAINEAVELSKKYGTGDSHRFVNGVLRNLLPKSEQLRRGSAL
jgi:transcription antitermination protein NusB